MKTTTTTTTTAATYEAIKAAYTQYEKDTAAVLANLDRTSPAPLIRQLQNSRRADEVARANPATAESIDEAESRHAEAREAIDEVDRISHRLTAAEAERIAAAQEGQTLRAEADEARHTAADLAKVIARTLSDRADLVQTAALADLEEPTETERAAALRRAEERGEELTAEEIEERAKQRHRRNSIARYVRAQRGGNALNGMHTDTTPATAAEVNAWRAAGKPIAEDYKEPTKGGTISLVWREATKTRPAGFYFVRRRYTVNQWTSIEALDEAGNPSGYIRTQNTLAADLDALERLEALAGAADLTAREREYLAAFCGKAARQAGAESRRAYHTEAGKKATEAGANAAEYESRRRYAFDRIGLTAASTRSMFFRRMCDKLAAAVPMEYTCQTPQEYAEKDRRYWERLQSESRRGTARTESRRPDLIAAQAKAAADITTAPAVKWIDRAEAEARAAQRAEQSRKAAEHSRIDNTTAEALERAAQAARAYAERAAAEDTERAERAKQAAKADRLAKARAAAVRADVCTDRTTFEMWSNWTDHQRAVYTEYLAARTA